jgi:hypothetical protein
MANCHLPDQLEFTFFKNTYGTLSSAQSDQDRRLAIENLTATRNKWLISNLLSNLLANSSTINTKNNFPDWCNYHGYYGHT